MKITQNPNSRLVYMSVLKNTPHSNFFFSFSEAVFAYEMRVKGFRMMIMNRPIVISRMKRNAVPRVRDRYDDANPSRSRPSM